jgi:hypothetical protein
MPKLEDLLSGAIFIDCDASERCPCAYSTLSICFLDLGAGAASRRPRQDACGAGDLGAAAPYPAAGAVHDTAATSTERHGFAISSWGPTGNRDTAHGHADPLSLDHA